MAKNGKPSRKPNNQSIAVAPTPAFRGVPVSSSSNNSNGTKRSKSKDAIKDQLVQSDPSRDYQSSRSSYYGELYVQNLPLWRLWTARMMITSDPTISFSMDIRNSALAAGRVKVKSPDPQLAKWVQEQWDFIWNHYREQLTSAKEFGFAPLQMLFKYDKSKQLCIKGVKDFAPEDGRALEKSHNLVGMRVKDVTMYNPRCLWLTFKSKYGNRYGWAITRRQYPAWYEKWMDHGAKKLQQQRMIKDAYIGDIFWYPPNVAATLPDGTKISWRDLMREVGENRLSGGALTLPRLLDNQGKELTGYTPPQSIPGATEIFQWVESCDDNILKAAGIPIEVVQAADSGSGFSGRSIPFLVLLNGTSGEFTEIVQQVDTQVLRPMVWLNKGRDAEYTIEPISLVESFAGDISGSSLAGGSIGGGPNDQQQQQAPPQQIPQQSQYSEQRGLSPIASVLPILKNKQLIEQDYKDFFIGGEQFIEVPEYLVRLRELLGKGREAAINRVVALAQQIKKLPLFETLQTLADMVNDGIRALRPNLTNDLTSDTLLGSVGGARDVFSRLPSGLVPPGPTTAPMEPVEGLKGILPSLPSLAGTPTQQVANPILNEVASVLFPDSVPEPIVHLPALEAAVETIRNSPPMAGSNYVETAQQVRSGAFAITGDMTEKAVTDVQNQLAVAIAEGKPQAEFIETVSKRLETEGSPLSPPHLENIFRNTTQAAYSNAQFKAVGNPLVTDYFPYAGYMATKGGAPNGGDGRTRDSHIALNTAGLDGTNIYRMDDPTFVKFRPPWSFSCRCSWHPVTVEQAAKKGVKEAQEWLERAKGMAKATGGTFYQYLNATLPAEPQHVTPPSFQPPAEFKREQVQLSESTKEEKAHEFSCLLFKLPTELTLDVLRLGMEIPEDQLAEDGRELEPHITCKFGFHTNDTEEVRKVVQSLSPIAVQLGNASYFEGKDNAYDVVKIEVKSQALHELNATVSKELECTDTYPTYQPHITIAYVRSGLGKYWSSKLNSLYGGVAALDLITFSNKQREHITIPMLGKAQFNELSTLQGELLTEGDESTVQYNRAPSKVRQQQANVIYPQPAPVQMSERQGGGTFGQMADAALAGIGASIGSSIGANLGNGLASQFAESGIAQVIGSVMVEAIREGMQGISVNVNAPIQLAEQAPANVIVNVPEQPAPIVNVNIPKQDPPIINNTINVPVAKPTKLVVERDTEGKIKNITKG